MLEIIFTAQATLDAGSLPHSAALNYMIDVALAGNLSTMAYPMIG